jgi:formamidopyrimidine-DNA glycosylase
MPELPEVEVTRLSFADRIAGAHILWVHLGKPLRWPLQCDPESLVGRQVIAVRRRGKYLIVDLSVGQLLLHLGMSGSLSFGTELPPSGLHDHFDMQTSQGRLRLNDPRRFGAVVYVSGEDDPTSSKLLGKLGMEPLTDDFTLQRFELGLKHRKAPIKQVLLAGELVVGVGNIYASEALFRAGIRPTRSVGAIGKQRVANLHRAIRSVLAQAVQAGGSTLRDFSNAQGDHGNFQLLAQVYGRAGEPCQVCGTSIRAIRQGQRSTFFCPACQKH